MKGSGAIIVIVFGVLSVVLGISDRFVFKINGDIHYLKEKLEGLNFKYLLQITPTVHSFRYGGSLSSSIVEQVLSEVKRVYKNEIVEIEQAREINNCIPTDRIDVMPSSSSGEDDLHEETEFFYGLNVVYAWSLGYIGSGINIAVLDVGINTDIDDLKKNVNNVLAFNYVDNTKNITPEVFHNYLAESFRFVDHGNRCASVIAAERGNGICSAGIAFAAKVVPVKIFSVKHILHRFILHTSSDIIGAGLTHGLPHVHIFSNSWSSADKFEPLDLAVREAILHGTTMGRNKLGAIYVVPDGSDGISGSGLANSIYSIAVNSVGIHGALSKNHQVSACVLTSGLGEGSTLNTNYILTSSVNNGCIKSFKGVSAVVAEVSAIIALVLQARPLLYVRDIQHLIVESSDQHKLPETVIFKRNGAGKLFNDFLGFGLIDAHKMVSLSKNWPSVTSVYYNAMVLKYLKHVMIKTPHVQNRYRDSHEIHFEMEENKCNSHVNTIEHVVLYIRHEILIERDMIIEIVSPSNTESIVVDNGGITNFNMDNRPRNLTSVHFWGESPFGQWKVIIQATHLLDERHLKYTSLSVYGTFDESEGKQFCNSRSTTFSRRDREEHTYMKTGTITESTTTRAKHLNYYEYLILPFLLFIFVGIIYISVKYLNISQ